MPFDALLSKPCSIHLIYTPTYKGTLRAEQEGNYVSALFRASLALECSWVIKHSVCWTVVHIPCVLHHGREYSPRCDGVHAHLSLAILVGRRFGQADDSVFAGIISTVFGKSYAC